MAESTDQIIEGLYKRKKKITADWTAEAADNRDDYIDGGRHGAARIAAHTSESLTSRSCESKNRC